MTPEARAAAVLAEHYGWSYVDHLTDARHAIRCSCGHEMTLPTYAVRHDAHRAHVAAALAAAGLLADPAPTAADGLREAVETLLEECPHTDDCSLHPCDCWQSGVRAALTATAQPTEPTPQEQL